jgi:transcriptional regulator GlxA family with amidase domain
VLVRDVLFLLFNGVDVLDFAGPYEVFSLVESEDGRSLCRIRTAAPTAVVQCRGGLRVGADYVLDNAPSADALIVPGGPSARAQEASGAIVEFLQEAAAEAPLVASVCTGAFVLARAGLLGQGPATTHSLRFAEFSAEFPDVRLEPKKIVDTGKVITAAGISSGIDLALHIVKRWFGVSQRNAVAHRLEGPWLPERS